MNRSDKIVRSLLKYCEMGSFVILNVVLLVQNAISLLYKYYLKDNIKLWLKKKSPWRAKKIKTNNTQKIDKKYKILMK